jgi:transcriptional regulator with XRE-family HTH domain
MFIMKSKYVPLGNEIQKYLDRLSWSQRKLARESDIGSSTISKIMRGEHRGTPDTITAIAKVLGLDPLFLMKTAGIPIPLEISNPAIDYIAQQLEKLPEPARGLAIKTVRGQVDAFHSLTNQRKPPAQEPVNPKIQKLIERFETMEDKIKDQQSLDRAINLLDSQLEILELAAKKS